MAAISSFERQQEDGSQLQYWYNEPGDIVSSTPGRLFGKFESHPIDLQDESLQLLIHELQATDTRSVEVKKNNALQQNLCYINAAIIADINPHMTIVKGFCILQLDENGSHFIAKKHWWNRDKRCDLWHDFTAEIDPSDNRRLLVESPLGEKEMKSYSPELEEQENRFKIAQFSAACQMINEDEG